MKKTKKPSSFYEKNYTFYCQICGFRTTISADSKKNALIKAYCLHDRSTNPPPKCRGSYTNYSIN